MILGGRLKSNYPDEFKVLTKEVFLDCMKNVGTDVLMVNLN